jgi:hypothetical protein
MGRWRRREQLLQGVRRHGVRRWLAGGIATGVRRTETRLSIRPHPTAKCDGAGRSLGVLLEGERHRLARFFKPVAVPEKKVRGDGLYLAGQQQQEERTGVREVAPQESAVALVKGEARARVAAIESEH